MDTKETEIKQIQKLKSFKTHSFKGSIKDLVNVVAKLKLILKKNASFDLALDRFKEMIEKNHYISYKKHVKGLSHHVGLGPSRRPILTYKYIVEVLKNLKTDISKLNNYKVSRIILNITNNHRLGGFITKSRGRAYSKDSRRANLVFFINYE